MRYGNQLLIDGLREQYSIEPLQLCVKWDGGVHGGVECNVGLIYGHQCDVLSTMIPKVPNDINSQVIKTKILNG